MNGQTTAVAVIGPGRVGTALALALPPSSYRVTAVAGRSPAGIEAFRRRFPGVRVGAAAEAVQAADLVLLTVPDDALRGLVRRLAADDAVRAGSRWVHTCGIAGTGVLMPARLAGARIAACHPAQTFPDPDRGRAGLPGCRWAVTAADADRGWAHELVEQLQGVPVTVPERARVLYHAGLAMGSNGTSAVVALARDLLLAAGIPEPEAFLEPLVGPSAQNAAQGGARALTGPVRRGDAATVAAHVEELRVSMPEALPAYRAVAELALSYARRAGLDRERAAAVRAVLHHSGTDPDDRAGGGR